MLRLFATILRIAVAATARTRLVLGTPALVGEAVVVVVETQRVAFETLATLLLLDIGHGVSAMSRVHR